MCLASDDECKEKKLNLKAVDDGVVKINNRLAELKTLQNALKRKVDMRDTALQRRSELIKSKFPDVYQACLWLDNNSSSFVGQWFKPAALCLSVDKELSKYLQCAVPRRDLFAMFFFEHVMDLSKFLTQCQDSQKLVVNASLIEMSNDENDTSSMEIDNIRKYGFTNYLVDVVNGPKPVIKYLCRHFAIQRIPIGSNSTNQYVREIIEKIPQLFLFFTDVWMYRVVKSRHTGKVSSNSSRIPNDCILASMHVPSNSDHTVEKQQHMTLQSKLKSIYTEKEECIAKRIEVVNILKSAEENKNKLYQQLKFKEIVRLKIKRIKSRIDCIHRQMFNVKDEEKLVAGKRCRIAMQCNKYLHTMFDTLKTVVQIQSEISEIESKLSETKHAVTTEEIELRLFTDSLDRLKIVVSDLKASANELKMALRAQLREIISMSSKTETNLVLSREELKKNIICPSILLKQFKCVHIKANSISEITCFDIDHKIAELQTRASLISDVDVTVLEEYEKREEAIHKFESDRDVIKEQLDALHSEIDSIKIEWMSNVQRLVDKINMHFVGFFKELICAGKVLLNVPADQMKFSDYGIDIQVQFRKESAMRSLSFGFQSGGERSVATMLYLLSLQFCVTCPFRLVDELNQGMDESNERTIMELVVKTVSNSGNQYFLISPKLVKDLSYNGDNVSVTVLCKSNSNYSFKSLRFKKKDDIEKETI
ncbi:hypothetical protein GJ496_007670 [Pomphorhynchus laevis]|nr:hypothetical protein GJ496_007670 [Pomphorhynchus laevis]